MRDVVAGLGRREKALRHAGPVTPWKDRPPHLRRPQRLPRLSPRRFETGSRLRLPSTVVRAPQDVGQNERCDRYRPPT